MQQLRGPNTLNLNSYTQDVSSQDRGQHSAHSNETDQMAIQEQFDNFVREIQQYDQILSKVAKNVEQVSHQNQFITEFYPDGALGVRYDNDQEKKIISSTDHEMAKIINSLERNNSTLKQELKGWYFQFAKKTRLTQILISQNKLLRKYVSSKNKQIVKLIQGISRADNEQLNQLKCTLDDLKQENGILIDHLKQIKNKIKEEKSYEQKLQQTITEANSRKIHNQAKFQQNQDKQQHSSKSATLLQQSQKQAEQREIHLLAERKKLLKLKQQYTEDSRAIDAEIDRCKIDRRDLDNLLLDKHRGKLTEKQASLEQIEEETETFQRLSKINKNHLQQIARNQNRFQQYTKINNDLERKILQQTQILRRKQKQMNQEVQNQTSMLSETDVLDYEIGKLKEKIQLKSLLEQEQRSKMDRMLKSFQVQRNDEINKWGTQLNKSKKQANVRNFQERNEIELKQKQIQSLENQIAQKNQDIGALVTQINQIKQREMVAAQMRQRLSMAQMRR